MVELRMGSRKTAYMPPSTILHLHLLWNLALLMVPSRKLPARLPRTPMWVPPKRKSAAAKADGPSKKAKVDGVADPTVSHRKRPKKPEGGEASSSKSGAKAPKCEKAAGSNTDAGAGDDGRGSMGKKTTFGWACPPEKGGMPVAVRHHGLDLCREDQPLGSFPQPS